MTPKRKERNMWYYCLLSPSDRKYFLVCIYVSKVLFLAFI